MLLVEVIESTLRAFIRKKQLDDDRIIAYKKILEKELYGDFFICDEILMKAEHGRDVFVVPDSIQTEIIKAAHEKRHFGVQKTMDSLQKEYYIDDLKAIVEKIIQCCIYKMCDYEPETG